MSEMDWNAVRETLMFNPKNGYQRISDQDRTEMETYCSAYMDFVGAAKTEREEIIKALVQTNGNKSKTAKILGIDRTVLYSKIRKYNLKI